MKMAESAGLLCPSSEPVPGALLVGVVRGPREVDIVPAVAVDELFVAEGSTAGPLDDRFRFANGCVKEKCNKWFEGRCRLIEVLADQPEFRRTPQYCSIRGACRWHSQVGARACTVCPAVVRQQPLNETLDTFRATGSAFETQKRE